MKHVVLGLKMGESKKKKPKSFLDVLFIIQFIVQQHQNTISRIFKEKNRIGFSPSLFEFF